MVPKLARVPSKKSGTRNRAPPSLATRSASGGGRDATFETQWSTLVISGSHFSYHRILPARLWTCRCYLTFLQRVQLGDLEPTWFCQCPWLAWGVIGGIGVGENGEYAFCAWPCGE